MYENLGGLIRTQRETLGVGQAELARQLGLGQQAVSGWERGRSRPRRSMLGPLAALLDVDVPQLLDAGGYATTATGTSPPARPLSGTLPLGDLPPDRFEDLVAELVHRRHPDAHVTRFGGPGEKQFGIDVLAAAENVNRATAQCKRHQQFGPKAVADAVGEVTIEAETHYLFLARTTATPAARTAITKHPGWQLWDGQDISRYIRSDLPLDQAVRIVDTYFPGHRVSFLGVPLAGPWLTSEEFFAQSSSQMFTHDWLLVGRADEAAEMTAALYGPGGAVAVLVGRGGTGKTRLLREIAESRPDETVEVRLLQAGTQVTPDGFELLPRDCALTILIDDAHERDDLAHLVTGIRRQNAKANVLLSLRPYGWDRMSAELARAGILTADLLTVRLRDLKTSDAETLASEALGESHQAFVQRLARVTLDCPLATVVGGVLIRRGELDPSQLEQDVSVRTVILRGFRDALVADPLVDDPATRNAVLDGIAALQPFRSNQDSFREALSALAGKPFDILAKQLRSLEDAGIVRRRGASLRIVPDLLGDVILAQASFDERVSTETGYLERIRGVADGEVLQHLFVNVSRVDWQVRQQYLSSPSLVDSLWQPLEAELRSSDIHGRQHLVKLLARVAYFQPERIIAAARWLIDNPTDHVSKTEAVWVPFAPPTYRDVLNELPPMLKEAAYNLASLPPVLQLLWELAQGDERATHQFPDHAMRVLTDLAAYGVGKPTIYNHAIVDAANGWFVDGQQLSPFDVLEPLLATEGSRQTYQEFQITFYPFALNVEAVSPIRDRVIQLALDEAKVPDVRRAVAGVRALEAALRYPNGIYARPVPVEEKDRWTPEFVETIRRLGMVARAPGLDPAVLVAIRETLNWHASYAQTATRPIAEAALASLPHELEHRVALIIHDGWGHLMRDRNDSFEVGEAKIRARLYDAVSALVAKRDDEIVDLIQRRLSVERDAFGPAAGQPGPLIAELVRARPSLAPLFVDLIVAGETVLEPLLPVVLATAAELDSSAALNRARQLLDLEKPSISRGVAQAIGWYRGIRPLADGELELLLDLARSSDPVVRQAPVVVAQRLARDSPKEAAHLITAVDFSDNPRLAEDAFMCFGEPLGLSLDQFNSKQTATIRKRLVDLPKISEYSITSFLAARSAINPAWVIELLQDRVTRAEGLESLRDYEAVPFDWDTPLRVREHPDFVGHLRQLQAWIASPSDSWVRRRIGSEVFADVVQRFDRSVLAVLEEALDSPNENDIRAVASILGKAQRTLIWDEPDFVRKALHASARFGDDCRQAMAGGFYGATISGVRSGTPGEPFREDVEQRDRSKQIADALPRGSIEEEFYRAMTASAEASIARSASEDRADDDRDW